MDRVLLRELGCAHIWEQAHRRVRRGHVGEVDAAQAELLSGEPAPVAQVAGVLLPLLPGLVHVRDRTQVTVDVAQRGPASFEPAGDLVVGAAEAGDRGLVAAPAPLVGGGQLAGCGGGFLPQPVDAAALGAGAQVEAAQVVADVGGLVRGLGLHRLRDPGVQPVGEHGAHGGGDGHVGEGGAGRGPQFAGFGIAGRWPGPDRVVASGLVPGRVVVDRRPRGRAVATPRGGRRGRGRWWGPGRGWPATRARCGPGSRRAGRRRPAGRTGGRARRRGCPSRRRPAAARRRRRC